MIYFALESPERPLILKAAGRVAKDEDKAKEIVESIDSSITVTPPFIDTFRVIE